MLMPDGTAAGLPAPVVYDASARALRVRTINFAANRFADMMYVSGLDRATAEDHFRWRAAMDLTALNCVIATAVAAEWR